MADSKTKISKLDNVQRQYLKDFQEKLIGLNLQTDLFATITFPSLPYNFQMMMSEIDWPDKAKKNPNGTLFMDPQSIDANSTDDIGLQCFASDKFNGDRTGLKGTIKATGSAKAQQESVSWNELLAIEALLEDSVNMEGSDIPVKDIKSTNEHIAKQNANIIQAITTYVKRSMTAIQPLVQMVSGDSAASSIQKVSKAINVANQVAAETVEDWLKEKNEAQTNKNSVAQQVRDVEVERDCIQNAALVYQCIALSDVPPNINRYDYMVKVASAQQEVDSVRKLNQFVGQYTDFGDWKTFNDWWKKNGSKPKKIEKGHNLKFSNLTDEGLEPEVAAALFEGDGDASDAPLKDIDYDKVQQDMFTTISAAIDEAIGPRDTWKNIKDVAAKMKVMKDQADTTIKERIKLVCKTGGQKSIFHHPKVANGLENMWSRYSAELQNRIDNRIAQLTGSTGSKESGSASMVEDFLRVTYPQIISVLLTYRCVFEQIGKMYRDGDVLEYTLGDVDKFIKAKDEEWSGALLSVLTTFDSVNDNI